MSFRRENRTFVEQIDVSPEVFSRPVITVELQPNAARHPGNTATFLLAVNLLSRTFEKVHAVFPLGAEAPDHPWSLGTIHAVVNELNHTVEGTLHIGASERSDVVLSIGDQPSVASDRKVVVRGAPWCAALDCDLASEGEGIFGFLYAACIGAAQVLLHVLNGMKAPYCPMAPFTFSLLDLLPCGTDTDTPKAITIPEAHLVGVGAVGSAAVYALAHLDDLQGVLHLIDNETVDETNLNRYVLMRRRNVGDCKVDIAAKALGRTAIRLVPFRDAFSCYVEQHGDAIDLLLSPVDSPEARRELARMLPRRVINAATGGTTVTVSKHGFNDGKACLHCLYPILENRVSREELMAADMGLPVALVCELVRTNAPVNAELVALIETHRGVEPGRWAGNVGSPIDSFYVKAVCGEAPLHLPFANVVAPLSFVSASAGILLAAELIKAAHPQLSRWTLDNYFRVDTLKHPNPAFLRLKPQEQSGRCICHDPDYISVFSDKYG